MIKLPNLGINILGSVLLFGIFCEGTALALEHEKLPKTDMPYDNIIIISINVKNPLTQSADRKTQ